MESNQRRLIIRIIVAMFLITAAIGIIGALASQQGPMKPTPTITASLGAIPSYADRATATPALCLSLPASTVDATLTNTANRQGALTAAAGPLATLTATAYPGQNNPGSYATGHPPTPVPTATPAACA